MGAPALPGYTVRELPPEDWSRLAGVAYFRDHPLPDPATARILVVETPDGTLAGFWIAMNVVMLEGLYILPEHRKKVGVAKRLLGGMLSLLDTCGVTTAFTLTVDPLVTRLAERHGFPRLPATVHLWTKD
jgi:hypothetical protein